MGETRITYDQSKMPARAGGVFMLKVAGYPRAGRIEIIQGSTTKRLRFKEDPGEAWVERYVSVRPGEPFTVRLVDESPARWLAVSQPVPTGRFDAWIAALLRSYSVFFAIGAAALGLLFLSWLRPSVESSPAHSQP